jgi:hypothetical protein
VRGRALSEKAGGGFLQGSRTEPKLMKERKVSDDQVPAIREMKAAEKKIVPHCEGDGAFETYNLSGAGTVGLIVALSLAHLPVFFLSGFTSHSLIVLSSLAEARVLPSGLHATELTLSE